MESGTERGTRVPAWPADEVTRWPLGKLTPYARNARTHSPEQVSQIAASILEWGWTNPVLVDEAGGIKNPEPEKVEKIPPNMTVRVRNQGPRFDCDLTAYGYGMRWPTGAVYNIPVSKYMELLDKGLDGVSA